MLETLKEIDRELFLYLNSVHTPFVDSIMFYVTDTEFWFPFYMVLIIILVWKLKWDSVPIILGILLTIGVSDLITSGIMKPWFARLRPCYEPAIKDLIHLIDDCGYRYGFASGHSANSFGLATFFFLSLKAKNWRTGWIFAWAFLVAYSRVYVGVHYPGDVLIGLIIGILMGILVFQLYKKLLPRWGNRKSTRVDA